MKVERKPVEEHVYVITLTPDEAKELHHILRPCGGVLVRLYDALSEACPDQMRRFW